MLVAFGKKKFLGISYANSHFGTILAKNEIVYFYHYSQLKI
jgi:hypothetical protein